MNPRSKRQVRRRRQHTKWRSKLLDNCRQLDCFPRRPGIKTLKAVTNPCPSARGLEQARTGSPCMRETLKRPTIVCRRPSRASWLPRRAWSSSEPRLKTSRRHHRSDGSTWNSDTDKLQPKCPTEPRPRSWKSCSHTESPSTCSKRRRTASRELQTSMRKSSRPRRQQKRQPRDQRQRRWRSMSSEALMTRMTPHLTPPPRHESKRASTSCYRLKPEVTPREWHFCGHTWPGTSAHLCPRRNRSKGSTGRRRAAQISIVTNSGNFWTTHAEWVAQVAPRHLVMGQEHRLEAGRCEEEAGKLERQGCRCGFSPAKRNALKTKSESSLATSAGTFVAAPKHWGMEWVWPARSWQSKVLQAHQGRLTLAWVPSRGRLTEFSIYFCHTEEVAERNQQLLEAASLEIRRCPGLWILAGDFNMEPETFWAIRHTYEIARSIGQASCTYFQTWSVGSLL